MIALRNNKKLLGKVKAFDRHMNMVMENVQEVWTEMPKKGKKGAAVTKSRFIPKMFLRGDSVIYVLKNPKWLAIHHIMHMYGYTRKNQSIKYKNIIFYRETIICSLSRLGQVNLSPEYHSCSLVFGWNLYLLFLLGLWTHFIFLFRS